MNQIPPQSNQLTRRQAMGKPERRPPTTAVPVEPSTQPSNTPPRPPRHARPAILARITAALLLATSAMPIAVVGPLSADAYVAAASGRGDTQSISVPPDATLQALSNETYTAVSGEELRAAANMRTAATFINDGNSPIQWPFPVGVPLTDRYGPREAPCGGCSTFHQGLDMTPGEGTPIDAIAAGTVIAAEESDSGFGVSVQVEHVVAGRKYVSLYAHMQFGSLEVTEGDIIAVGQKIGEVGNTGQSTGPHLHLEIWEDGTDPIDPYAWLTEMVG